MLKTGKAPFYEPDLQEYLDRHVASGRLRFTESTADATEFGEVIFVCVSTPSREDGSADMQYFESVSRDIAAALTEYRVIVEKSTVPVRTSERMRANIRRYLKTDVEFDVASNPEFLAEGSAIHDTMQPSRIVIGTDSDRARDQLLKVYEPFDSERVLTSIPSAEMIKLASNAHLAMRLSFVNALSQICEKGKANIDEVVHGMGLDSRIGSQFLGAGIGYGGSCFPKDVQGMHAMALELGYDFEMLRQVHLINEDQWLHLVNRLCDELWSVKGKTIGLWGVSFKPGTDDVREAPAIKIARELVLRGATLQAYDPVAVAALERELPEARRCETALDAARDADALILATEWQEFRDADPEPIAEVMRVRYVFDGRIALDEPRWLDAGFTYRRIGRR